MAVHSLLAIHLDCCKLTELQKTFNKHQSPCLSLRRSGGSRLDIDGEQKSPGGSQKGWKGPHPAPASPRPQPPPSFSSCRCHGSI
eukprot:2372068-Pyramimonas_sp.AAC.1